MKYLEYYKSCMMTGKLIAGNGLCHEPGVDGSAIKELFSPTDEDCVQYNTNAYWASGYNYLDWDNPKFRLQMIYDFTPLRQTIVLFMAAMNNEL